MKKQYIYSALILTAVLCAGCAKEFEGTLDENNSTSIELSSVNTDPVTKALITGTAFSTEEAAAGIGLSLLDGKGNAYGTNVANVRYGYSDGKWTAVSPLRVGGSAGILYGYYPYSSTVTDITEIPVASSVNGTDWLYATPEEVTTSTAKNISLSLKHALARVSLSFKLDTAYVGSGALSSISLSGDCVAASGKLNAKTGGIESTSSKFTASTEQTLSKSASTTLECLVVPVANESGTPELKASCTIDGKVFAATFSGDNAVEILKGVQTSISFTVKNTGIEVNAASISQWGEGDTKEVTVGENYSVTIKLAEDVVAGDIMMEAHVDGSSLNLICCSKSGQHLKCTMPDGEFCTSQSKSDNMVYTFTLSDISEETTATIGYANRLSFSVHINPSIAGTVTAEGDFYEGEPVRIVPNPDYRFGIAGWKDKDGNMLSDSYDYYVRMYKNENITACFKRNLILDGLFTVYDEDKDKVKKVQFTRGNLYRDNTSCKIEQRQYDFNPALYTTKTAHVSHFMWSSDLDEATSRYYGQTYGQSPFFTNKEDFSSYNSYIENGCYTMSKDEWKCLLTGRKASTVNGTTDARYFKGSIQKDDGDSINGLFLFPDEFTWPVSVTTQPSGINDASAGFINTYTYNEFKRMQDAGIVFLAAAGFRIYNETVIYSDGSLGCYWSSTSNGEKAYSLDFSSDNINSENETYVAYGYAVRLVTTPLQKYTITFESTGCEACPEPFTDIPNNTRFFTDGNTLNVSDIDNQLLGTRTVKPDASHSGMTAVWNPSAGIITDDTVITVSFQ